MALFKVGGGADVSGVTATPKDVLSGKQFVDADGNQFTGIIPLIDTKTITPGISDKIIKAGGYLYGNQTIKGDTALTARNIARGASIFGVAGSYRAVWGPLNCATYTYNSEKRKRISAYEYNIGFKPMIVFISLIMWRTDENSYMNSGNIMVYNHTKDLISAYGWINNGATTNINALGIMETGFKTYGSIYVTLPNNNNYDTHAYYLALST